MDMVDEHKVEKGKDRTFVSSVPSHNTPFTRHLRQTVLTGALLRILTFALLVTGLLALTLTLGQTAYAAGPFNVNTTNDTHCTGFVSQNAPGCTAVTDGSGNISLRSALEDASTLGGTTTINLPAGTYNLTLGDLVAGTQANTNITIHGTGTSANTSIHQTQLGRMVIVVNWNVNANVVFNLDNVTVSGGSENQLDPDGFGGNGGAILAGGVSDNSLTLTNVVFSGNYCSPAPPNTGCSGGAVSMTGGGGLTVTGCTFAGNDASKNSGFGAGGAIYFDNGGNGGNVSITNSTFTNNTAHGDATTGGQGGAIRLAGGAGTTYTVTNNTFTGNAANGTAAAGANGGAITLISGTLGAHFNRIVGNISNNASGLFVGNNAGTIGNATDNWWGCNGGPSGGAGCDTAVLGTPNQGGSMTSSPWIVLTNSASPNPIKVNLSTTLTASFLQNSAATPLTVGNISTLIGLPVTWSNPILGSLSGQQTTIQSNGQATATFTAGATGGTGHADAKVDNGTATADITIVGPPTINKTFGAALIPLNGSTSLSFTINNPNTTTALTGVGFSDTFPAGLMVSTPNGLTNTCGGTATATAGSGSVSLTGGTVAASSSCTFSVNVTGTAGGTLNNTTGAVTSTEGGTGNTSNTASIAVVAPPSIAKVFNPGTIALNATSSLTFTITNQAANTVALTGVTFTDTLPTGLTVANASVTVCGGTLTTTAPTGIALSGASISVSSQCQFSVTVTGAASGNYSNTTGNVTSTNGGVGNTASANLAVAGPPAISKAFGAATIPLSSNTTLTLTITNPNSGLGLTGVAFTDNLPAGLAVATPNGLSNTCGGTATATAGSSAVSLSGGTLAANGSCTVSVNVTGTSAGVKNNSVQVTSTEGGTGNASNASITVVTPSTLTKVFGAASIPLNGSTSLSFTVNNPNTTTALTGIGFSDTFPAGLVVSTPNGLTGSCGGGTITATQGTNVVSLSGASLAASTSCTFSLNVTGIAGGTQNNTTGAVSSTEGGAGGTASASIAVVAPPSLAKSFNPGAIAVNATSLLTFTITNPAANTVALSGVAFNDTFPAGIVVSTPNGLTNTCGGTATATAGSASVSLTGGTVAASSSCAVSVNVTGVTVGVINNTTSPVTSANGGTGNTSNTASITVGSPPTLTKSFGKASVQESFRTSLNFTIMNPNASTALTGLAFTDTLPAGLVISTPNGLIGNCGGGSITATAGTGLVTLSGATLAANSSCNFSVNVTGTTTGLKTNTTSALNTAQGLTGSPATASLTVTATAAVPTLTGWGIILFMLLLGLSYVYFLKRRRRSIE
jgi:fimbrial isopeptide formation D2 family protein